MNECTSTLEHTRQTAGSVNWPLSWPRMRLYMLRSPNTFRKYHDAELTLQWQTRQACQLMQILLQHLFRHHRTSSNATNTK